MKNSASSILSGQYGGWIFIAALATRLVYFAWSQSSPFLYQISNDEAFYIDYARAILNDGRYPYANFMDPLIAYLLVVPLYFSDNLHLARLLFLIMDSANACLLYKVTAELTSNKKSALLSAFIYMFYSLSVIYSVFITKSVPIIFLLLLSTYCFLRGIQVHRKIHFFMAGVCSSLLIFLGASFVLLTILYGCVLLMFSDWRRYFPFYGYGCLVLLLVYNAFFYIGGETKSILPTNGGIVFYISNHANNPLGTHEVPAFVHEATPQGIYQSFREQAQKEKPSIHSDSEVSSFWYHKAWQENSDNYLLMLSRLGNKLRLLVANDEISQNYYFPYIKQHTLKNLPLFTFALVFGFGVSGFLVFSVFERKTLFVIAPVIVVITTCLLFFVSARMRMPLLPFLMAGCSFWMFAPYASFKKQLTGVVMAILLSVLSYSAADVKDEAANLQDQYNLAVVMMKAGMLVNAGDITEDLLSRNPLPKFMLLKAMILSQQGKCAEALPLYEKVIALMPNASDVIHNRQVCLQYMKQHL